MARSHSLIQSYAVCIMHIRIYSYIYRFTLAGPAIPTKWHITQWCISERMIRLAADARGRATPYKCRQQVKTNVDEPMQSILQKSDVFLATLEINYELGKQKVLSIWEWERDSCRHKYEKSIAMLHFSFRNRLCFRLTSSQYFYSYFLLQDSLSCDSIQLSIF